MTPKEIENIDRQETKTPKCTRCDMYILTHANGAVKVRGKLARSGDQEGKDDVNHFEGMSTRSSGVQSGTSLLRL